MCETIERGLLRVLLPEVGKPQPYRLQKIWANMKKLSVPWSRHDLMRQSRKRPLQRRPLTRLTKLASLPKSNRLSAKIRTAYAMLIKVRQLMSTDPIVLRLKEVPELWWA